VAGYSFWPSASGTKLTMVQKQRSREPVKPAELLVRPILWLVLRQRRISFTMDISDRLPGLTFEQKCSKLEQCEEASFCAAPKLPPSGGVLRLAGCRSAVLAATVRFTLANGSQLSKI
jgi:hypothetical protein